MGSGLALGSCASAVARVATDDMKWDKTTDVLVLGFGGAGAAAAIEAKKKGADVLILEKMPQPGGNTAVSAGGFMCPDDEAKAYEYLKGPYYALELWPTLVNTQGGPRRDEKARIVSALGKTIPRLYGAGELGSMWGSIYQGACNNAEALVFGRIAGRNAADEKPWC